MIRAGADPGAIDADGRTPLHLATCVEVERPSRPRPEKKKPVVLELLLAAGADPKVVDRRGKTALHYAAELWEIRGSAVYRELFTATTGWSAPTGLARDEAPSPDRGPRAPATDSRDDDSASGKSRPPAESPRPGSVPEKEEVFLHGETALHRAAYRGCDAAEIETLLQKTGADPNARDDLGDTPLHDAAAGAQDPAVIRLLVRAGANINAKNRWNATPLHYAARHNRDPAVIEALLAAGAKVGAEDCYRNTPTPLHDAARCNEEATVIETLLEAGAKVDAPDKDGRTPLFAAARFNPNPAVVRSLVAAGANLRVQAPFADARDTSDGGLLLSVKGSGGIGIGRIAPRGRKGGALHHAVVQGSRAVVEALLTAGADINGRDEAGRAPLHLAASAGEVEIVGALLAAGANPKARDEGKQTPLQRVAHEDADPAVRALLLAVGDAEPRDGEQPASTGQRRAENRARHRGRAIAAGFCFVLLAVLVWWLTSC